MATTTHLGITLVEQSQAQKEVTVNQAFTRIDALMNTGAKSRTTNTPPGSPASGDMYIVGSSPTGAWAGQPQKIAYFDQVWKFITPSEGINLWVNDEDKNYVYDGTNWTLVVANDLAALEALSTTGLAARTATDTWTTRTITQGTGISVTNGNGVSGNPTIALSAAITNLTDTSISSPTSGESLIYNGSAWQNTQGQTVVFSNIQSGTTYTLVSGDSGKIIRFTNASAITLTLPNSLAVGFNCTVIQAGAGQITFSPAGGANRRNRQSHTKAAGQWAVCNLQVITNSGGNTAEYVLSGDTAA